MNALTRELFASVSRETLEGILAQMKLEVETIQKVLDDTKGKSDEEMNDYFFEIKTGQKRPPAVPQSVESDHVGDAPQVELPQPPSAPPQVSTPPVLQEETHAAVEVAGQAVQDQPVVVEAAQVPTPQSTTPVAEVIETPQPPPETLQVDAAPAAPPEVVQPTPKEETVQKAPAEPAGSPTPETTVSAPVSGDPGSAQGPATSETQVAPETPDKAAPSSPGA